MLDPVLLSRIQFAWVIAWHILLPAITVGLASYIAVLEGLWFTSGRDVYLHASTFWTRIFSVTFGMGVVSGIVMPFQIGSNWSRYAYDTANVISPMLAYEGLMAFFLEASFLGVLLFGRKLVPPWAHFVAALMVAAGTLFSSFWILVVNSWMQTPAGYRIEDGRFLPTDWLAIMFNPSFPTRLLHTVTGFYITTGFVVLSVAAWYLRHDRFVAEARLMLSTTLWLLLVLVPLQIVLGDASGLITRQYQPAKLAAIEAHWDTGSRVPLILFALPDQENAVNHHEVSVPGLGSLILTHEMNGTVQGLKDFPRTDWPPVTIVFFAFRVMVGAGLLMLAIVIAGSLLRYRGRLYTSLWFLGVLRFAAPLGFIAVLAGWTTTEVGRQPWAVYGLLRTADAVSPSLTGGEVVISLIGYIATYAVIFPGGWFVLRRIVRQGPSITEPDEPTPVSSGRPRSPVRPA